jgi:hypothetical protein
VFDAFLNPRRSNRKAFRVGAFEFQAMAGP